MSTVLSSSTINISQVPIDKAALPALEHSIHVWWLFHHGASTPEAGDQQASWWDWLSADELDRASRFHFSHHAEEWVANRARLRMLLGHYLQQDGEKIHFSYDTAGKPRIADNNTDLQFNLSHTEGLAIVAVTRGSRLGVDVERADLHCDAMELARFAFSSTELTSLCSLSNATEQQAVFLKLWTCKEAFLKGLGDGLSRSMADFSISFDQQHPRLTECSWDPSCVNRWHFSSLDAPNGYTASLAVEGSKSGSIKAFSWGTKRSAL